MVLVLTKKSYLHHCVCLCCRDQRLRLRLGVEASHGAGGRSDVELRQRPVPTRGSTSGWARPVRRRVGRVQAVQHVACSRAVPVVRGSAHGVCAACSLRRDDRQGWRHAHSGTDTKDQRRRQRLDTHSRWTAPAVSRWVHLYRREWRFYIMNAEWLVISLFLHKSHPCLWWLRFNVEMTEHYSKRLAWMRE